MKEGHGFAHSITAASLETDTCVLTRVVRKTNQFSEKLARETLKFRDPQLRKSEEKQSVRNKIDRESVTS